MAADWKPEPPRSAEEWEIWADACIQNGHGDILPQEPNGRVAEPSRPVDGVETRYEGFWYASAHSHPFEGTYFCWRCVANAQGNPAGSFDHWAEDQDVICWGSPAPSAEDPEPNTGQARIGVSIDGQPPVRAEALYVTPLDAEGRPTGERRQIFPPVAEEGVDTGTFFYTPPTRHPWRPVGALALGPIESPPESRPTEAPDHRDTWPPSWTDDEPGRPEADPEPDSPAPPLV